MEVNYERVKSKHNRRERFYSARENNTTARHISEVAHKKRKQAGGYDWKLISDT